MANPENLKPFSKDDNRAVEGGKKSKRPKYKRTIQKLLEKLDKTKEFNQEELMHMAMILKVQTTGDAPAYNAIMDRRYGKEPQINTNINTDVEPSDEAKEAIDIAAKALKDFDDEL